MRTIIIPGYSLGNKEWAEETAQELNKKGFEAEVYYWKHWNTPGIPVLENIPDILQLIGDEKVNIIVKSIGTLVISKMLPQIDKNINKLIFCGIPITDVQDDLDIYKSLATINEDKIVVFQNSKDNHGSFDSVVKFLKQINPKIKIVSKEADTHHYPYYSDFIEFLV